MINISTRRAGNYVNIEVEIDGFSKDLGLHSKEELTTLCDELKEAYEDIKSYIDYLID